MSTGRRVIALVGEEEALIEEAIAHLLDRFLPPHARDLNLDRLDAEEVPIEEILNRADTFPFWGEHRVVVVRNVDRLPAASQERLAAYLESGPPPSLLVLTARALDRRRRLGAVLQRVGEVRTFDRLDPEALGPLLQRRARELGKRLHPEAARALVTAAGSSLRVLLGELHKLAAYTGSRAEITVEDVQEVVVGGGEVSAFALVDAIAEADVARALYLVRRLVAEQSPIALVALLAAHFRALLATKALGPRASPDQVRSVLGARAWLYARYVQQLRRMGAVDLRRIYRELLEADLRLKTTGLAPQVVLERLVVQLIRITRQPPTPSGRP